MNDVDFYKILELSDNPTELEIKKLYKRLVKMYHPDLYNTKSKEEKMIAEEKMKEINSAYREAMKYIKNKQPEIGKIDSVTLEKIDKLIKEIEKILQEINQMNERIKAEEEAKLKKKKGIFSRIFSSKNN